MQDSFITTFSGFEISLTNPSKKDISIVDIATGLSNCCRFTGQLDDHYSVAQHSVIVSKFVDNDLSMKALLHDASEAYTGDMVSPLKALFPAFKKLELHIQEKINAKYTGDVTQEEYDQIKAADSYIGDAEYDYFFRNQRSPVSDAYLRVPA